MPERTDVLSGRLYSAQAYLLERMRYSNSRRRAVALFRADLQHYRLHGHTVTGQKAYIYRNGLLHPRENPAPGAGRPEPWSASERNSLDTAAEAAMALAATADRAEWYDIDAVFFDELADGEELPVAAASIRECKLTAEELADVRAALAEGSGESP